MNLVEKEFVGFMKKFDAFPFQMVINGESLPLYFTGFQM